MTISEKVIYCVCFLVCFLGIKESKAQNTIIVSKAECMLYVISTDNDTLFSAPVGLGANYGNKTKANDKKTPEGTFPIISIESSSHWTHDFHDGYGARRGAYGPWFFRLRVPRCSGIGIHGTCFPESIGTRCSDGCVRLNNNDLTQLKEYIKVNMNVTITGDELTDYASPLPGQEERNNLGKWLKPKTSNQTYSH